MLGKFLRVGSNNLRTTSVTAVARYNFVNCCHFSDDSHDDFKPTRKNVPEDSTDALKLIDKHVKENPVIIFMKGTPSQPQCGFSAQSIRILNAIGVEFASVNVLDYPSIREGIKAYSDWPTIPQLFINGEFVGGCDIMTSMYQEGELTKMLKDLKLIDPNQIN